MNRAERRALVGLVDEFGAEITVSIRAHERMNLARRIRERSEVDVRVDWPADSLTVPARVTVIVGIDTPNNQLSMLRTTLQTAGLSMRTDCTTIYLAGERGAIDAAIHAADAPAVLLVGSEPVAWWRADIRMRQVVGGIYPAKLGTNVPKLTGVIESPGAVLRGMVQPQQWRATLARFVEAIEADDPTEVITWRCVHWLRDKETTCGQHAYAWDELGLPWCRQHMEKGWDAGIRGASRQRKLANVELQEALL